MAAEAALPACPEHRLRLRVRYAESDQMGYAHHGAYIIWLELSRIEWLRAVGESYRDLEAAGVLMPVVDCQVRYRRPLRFDDEVELTTRISASGPSRLTFATTIRRVDDQSVAAEGSVTVASVARDGRPTRLPERLVQLLRASPSA